MEILGFFGGLLSFYSHSWLAVLFICLVFSFRPSWRLSGMIGLGYVLGMGHEWWFRDLGMPAQAVVRQAVLTGSIATIPKQAADKTQFDFELITLNHKPVHARIQLSCFKHCPVVHSGQYWTLAAKLHTIHNLNNPGGFDYKTYLATKHIHWVGFVLQGSMHRDPHPISLWNIDRLREKLATHLVRLISDESCLGIVQALTIGVTSHISQAAWTLFRCTGTTHLMVISGAHIGLVAGMMFKLISGLWSRSPWLCLRYPSQQVGSVVAILSSIAYAVVAGFAAPAERATIAAMVVFLRYLGQRYFGAWQAWRFALLLVLLTEPHAVLLPGFYLSFAAVAILLAMNRRIRSHKIVKALGIQISCMLGLLPLTLYWFAYGSLSGLFANIIAIPWVSFVIVPLAFLGLGIGAYLPWVPKLLQLNIQYLLKFLQGIDGLAWMNLQLVYPNLLVVIAGLLAVLIMVFLPILDLVPVAIALAMIAVYPRHPMIPDQTFTAEILDVGQGLAVLIQTHAHTLLYDTGGRNYHGSDMGNLVILPYFQYIGLTHLDKIIISHPDLDHRGGLESLQKNFPQAELIVDEPAFYHQGVACHDYPQWTWEGVHFQFFPIRENLGTTNNHSCVLKVSTASGQLLLTGDIEQAAEQVLIQHYGAALRASVLIVPHHGSHTSSSLAFLRTVAPEYAIFSYGFDNRYHFPHAKILSRYHALNILTGGTAEHGMITVDFSQKQWQYAYYADLRG